MPEVIPEHAPEGEEFSKRLNEERLNAASVVVAIWPDGTSFVGTRIPLGVASNLIHQIAHMTQPAKRPES